MHLEITDLPSLKTWKRQSLIDWLCWNDKNGVYSDKDCKAEGIEPLTKKEAIKAIKKIVFDSVKTYITHQKAIELFLSGEDVWFDLEDQDEEESEASCIGLQYGDTIEDINHKRKYFKV